jgi:hypothetical protein
MNTPFETDAQPTSGEEQSKHFLAQQVAVN